MRVKFNKFDILFLFSTDNVEPTLKRSRIDVDFGMDSGASIKVSLVFYSGTDKEGIW